MKFNKQSIPVCRDALCALYQESRKKIERAQIQLKAGKNAPLPDMRGRHNNRPHKIQDDVVDCIVEHVEMFPAEESHYSRNKNAHKKCLSPLLNVTKMHELYLRNIAEYNLADHLKVKLSFYRKVFDTKFNLSFGQPKSDTCSICDSGVANSAEHKERWENAFEVQKIDRQIPTTDKSICYMTMDLQKTMPLPKLSTSKAFYLRQMWLYIFGIHCVTDAGHKSYFFNWTEDVAKRGSNEEASLKPKPKRKSY